MRKTRWIGVVALLIGTVLIADAQQPQRGQRGQGGFGFGGPVSLLKNKSVAEDIKLSDDQVEKLKTWSTEYQEKSKETNKAAFAKLKDATPEERTKIMSDISTETYTQLGNILNPSQIKRIKQIELQAVGVRAFSQADVVSALKLTDDEKEKIKTISDEYRASFGRGGAAGGRPDAAKMATARKDAMTKSLAVLTDEQKTTWTSLIGEPFDTTKLTQGIGGRGTRPGTTPPKD